MLLPFIGGMLAGNSVHAELAPQTDRLLFNIFMGTALAVSALPVIVRIIEDLKMLHWPSFLPSLPLPFLPMWQAGGFWLWTAYLPRLKENLIRCGRIWRS